MPMPSSKTIPRLLAEMADRFPEREALVAGDARLTYRRLHAEVVAIARGLSALGIGHGAKVAVLMGNRPEWVIAALAAASLGAVAVAVNTWATARELAYVLGHSDATCVVAVPKYLKADYAAILGELKASGAVSIGTLISVGEAPAPETWIAYGELAERGESVSVEAINATFAAVAPDDVAFLAYTSGSTSTPKGVQLVHRSWIENTWRIGERQHVTENDRVWLAVSLFWGFGCSNALPNMLTHGGCVVLQESFEPGAALELIERERCTLFYGTPNMAQAMHEHHDRVNRDLSSLRSGATLGTPQQIMRVVELGARQICNVYGLTEIYGNCHVTDADDPLERRLITVGQPLEGVSQRIVDPETEIECPVDTVGEIRLKGYVTPGYYKDPIGTAKAFDENGYFRTGDLGSIDAEGRLFFRGRLKEVVKTGGMLVSPAEVEAALMTHPQVQLALVVGIPDLVKDEILAAIIVPSNGAMPAENELIALCRSQLAAYKVPRRFAFAEEGRLPLTTTGKIQKNKLAEHFFTA